MSVSPGFRDFLADQMTGFGPVTIKRMFGGLGLFREGLMFALVVDDVLYLKSNSETAKDFGAENLASFAYATKNGQRTPTSYRRAPERCLDDVDEMANWCAKAYAVARSSQGGKGVSSPARRPSKPRRSGGKPRS